MNPVILYSVHTLLAVVLAAGVFAPRRWRRPILLAAATVGCLGGIALAVVAGDETVWRSTTLGQPRGAIVGAAVACAWLLAGSLGDDRTLGAAGLVGLACSGVLVATLGDWVVPALVLWLASSVALVALVSQHELRVGALLSIGVSDLALVGAFTLHALDERVWTTPQSLDGLPLALALASFVVRSGALPLTGVWETLDSRAAPALPLLLGGPLALLGVPLSGSGPWFSVAALVAGVGLCGAALAAGELRLSLLGSWPVWLSLGLLVADPAALQPAALAALLAVSMVALWPATRGGARAGRGFLLGFLPPTAGWVAVAATAVLAFGRAGGASPGGQSAAWGLIAGLLLVAVAAGVALAARIARQSASSSSDMLATWAARSLFLAGVGFGLARPSAFGLVRDLLGDLERVLALNGAALALAVVAGTIAYRRGAPKAEIVGADVEASGGTLVYSEDRADTAVMVGIFALIALGTLAAVVYLAVEGLSYGFLPPSDL